MTLGPLSRRRFVAAVAALAALPALSAAARRVAAAPPALADRLAGLLSSPRAAAVLAGHGAIRSRFADADAALAHLAQSGGASPEEVSPLSGAALRRYLRTCVRNDFLARRTVAVDGWVITESEAYVLALAGSRPNA